MRRAKIPKHLFGPPALCDNCMAPCCTLDQAGNVCYRCGAGLFVHRSFWEFSPCVCGGEGCPICAGLGCVARPKEWDLDEPGLWSWYASLPDGYRRRHGVVPGLIESTAEHARRMLSVPK